jgi:hypothetical protein
MRAAGVGPETWGRVSSMAQQFLPRLKMATRCAASVVGIKVNYFENRSGLNPLRKRTAEALWKRVVSYLTEELFRQGHEVILFASGDSGAGPGLPALVAPGHGPRRSKRPGPTAPPSSRRTNSSSPINHRSSKRASCCLRGSTVKAQPYTSVKRVARTANNQYSNV